MRFERASTLRFLKAQLRVRAMCNFAAMDNDHGCQKQTTRQPENDVGREFQTDSVRLLNAASIGQPRGYDQ